MAFRPDAGSFGSVGGLPVKKWEMRTSPPNPDGNFATAVLTVDGKPEFSPGDEVDVDMLFAQGGRFGFFGCKAMVEANHTAERVVRVAFVKLPVCRL